MTLSDLFRNIVDSFKLVFSEIEEIFFYLANTPITELLWGVGQFALVIFIFSLFLYVVHRIFESKNVYISKFATVLAVTPYVVILVVLILGGLAWLFNW